MPFDDRQASDLAGRLCQVSSVVGVVLGGSRARGDAAPDSDVDLGLVYRAPLDLDGVTAVARDVAGPTATLTAPGEWGPWVDGGGWLTISGTAVDLIYRDLDRVRQSWDDAQAGRYRFHAQVGHPLGVPDFAYAGELALGRVLADPTGELRALQAETRTYPPALATALADGMWEADFLLAIAHKAVGRGDTTYVAGCLFRLVGLCAHALHGRAGVWLVNEKGAVASAGRLSIGPRGFADRAHRLLSDVGRTPGELGLTLERARVLAGEVGEACGDART